VIFLLESASFSRENGSPGLIVTSRISSGSGRSSSPPSLTLETVYFSPSVTLTTM
jgi:hypothetical protein